MKVVLYKRYNGQYHFIKEVEIPKTFRYYLKKDNLSNPYRCGEFFEVKEDRLIDNLPDDFLPVPPEYILITVLDLDKKGSTGQYNLKRFKDWGKYFDAYNLELSR